MKSSNINGALKEASIYRKKLTSDLPVQEHQVKIGGVLTAYLEGGEGVPLVLLHGPGESSVWWMRSIPFLVQHYKVLVPDFPGHGASDASPKKLDTHFLLNWLDSFISQTCSQKPVLVGHVVGGALAAHYAREYGNKVKGIVLVDSLGLSSFFPAPRFAFEFFRFMMFPSEKSYLRFLPQCLYDIKTLSKVMGKYWQPFLDYNLVNAKNPEKKAAAKAIMGALSGKIPEGQLRKISVPVALIWGRHDKANKLKVAQKASEKYGWPLQIIEETRDDPKLERPEEFAHAIQVAIDQPVLEK
ncbi:alpha/beta hydrolase [Echinicola jeungdonensis]|uniref:Alpha/beta fold hydrolase n=1 Tax=Echinicola jeungdonensis TaxID=709343 RepID=A0ABV5J923_9BACT|nr:alpha/beta hydrolase [Echinicola jeungdonensis]MDN3669390.1 alpha/beta hydrolase [Echinicola jeungdonensis]